MIKNNRSHKNQTALDDMLKCKIIPFPRDNYDIFESRLFSSDIAPQLYEKIVVAKPGEKIPASIPDFRPYLQRDGLILLSWDKRLGSCGATYIAYWVTSSGILRYYASPALSIENFQSAMPSHKSYAAEDGIEFYGDPDPFYMVHVAPELMMSRSRKAEARPAHIKKLKLLGINVDFDYQFLLSKERKKSSTAGRHKKGA